MKIVFDTNVLVSAFLKPHSHAAKILRLILQGEIEIVADSRILNEYEEVLARPKFKLDEEKVKVVLDLIRLRCIKAPATRIKFSLPDEDDTPFIETALAGDADYLITGNKRHFPAKSCRDIKALSPDEFLKL